MKTVQSLGAVIGPTALITALLFYFGYVKVASFSDAFGLDVSLFGLSTQDYLLQSIRSVFIPLGAVLIAGLGILWVHRVVSHQIELRPDRPIWRRLEALLAVVGVGFFAAGLSMNADIHRSDTELVLVPLSLMLGVGLSSYAVLVHRHRRRPDRPAPPASSGPPSLPGLSVILVSLLIAVGLTFEVANYADVTGRREARFVLDQLTFKPGVVVYSPKRLHIGADGVQETRFDDSDSAYGFRYDGLKLLFHSNGRYFLVPESWSPNGGTTVVLPDDDKSLRVEFVHTA